MARSKKTKTPSKRKSRKTKTSSERNTRGPTESEKIYVRIIDFRTKRRHILESIKEALLMQEEFENLLKIRRKKIKIISETKKEIGKLKADFQSVKKLMPSIRLSEIFGVPPQSIKFSEGIPQSLEEVTKKSRDTTDKKKKPHLKRSHPHPPNTRLGRIRNNLELIESKLNRL